MSQTKAQLVGGVGISTVRDLSVYGGLNVSGIATATNVSVAQSITATNVSVAQSITATNVSVAQSITASTFYGDGSGLTGAGSTVADDTSTDATFYPVLTQTTSGTITASKVSTTKLSFNPSTGTLTATDLNSSSDASLKENIITIKDALDTVNNLHGVKFNWKEDGRVSYGVIAQELEQVLPELVSNTNPKTVNYNGIIGVLIEAVKELSQRVEDLENKF